MNARSRPNPVDQLVAWACQIFRLQKYTRPLQQLVRFAIVGIVNTAINWFVFFSLCQIPNFSPLIANAIAFVTAMIFSFWANTSWVFETTKRKSRQRLFLEFALFNSISFLLFDEAMLAALIYLLKWGDVLAKVITTVCGMIFNFITRKMFLEDRKKSTVSKR